MLLVIETKQKVYFVKCQLKLSEILKNLPSIWYTSTLHIGSLHGDNRGFGAPFFTGEWMARIVSA